MWAEIKVCGEALNDEFFLLDVAVLQAQVAYIELSSTEQLGELFLHAVLQLQVHAQVLLQVLVELD